MNTGLMGFAMMESHPCFTHTGKALCGQMIFV